MKKKRSDVASGIRTWQKTVIIIFGAVVAVMALLFGIGLYQRWHSQGIYRDEYAGRVMDKWVNYHESQQGTRISRHLLIRPKEGEPFQVVVGPELYEDVNVDSWIVKNKEGVRVLASEP